MQKYEWLPEKSKEAQVMSGTTGWPHPEKEENDFWRLRSHELQNGYVVEVRSKSEIGSFEKFTVGLRTHIPKTTLNPGKVSVEYTTLNKDKMYFSFPNVRKLNGKQVDLSQTKLFDSPFLHADVGSEMLTMTYKKEKLVLDFKKVTITE